MTTQAVFTIISNNYLHYARTLMQSVLLHHPQAKRYCVMVDTDMQPASAFALEFEAIALNRLALPLGDEFYFQYSILELNTAVKPWALAYLLDQGYDQVLYIDPDIYLYGHLTEVETLLQEGAAIVLTPHLLAPMTDTRAPSELAIRMAGTYNLGFIAISDRPSTRTFLTWWQAKLERDCVVDFANGIFVDQSWIDLVPAMFEDVRVLRDPGYNVAYWNLAQRPLTGDVHRPFSNGSPLAFFHFSGLDPQAPQKISKYQNRHTLDSVDPIARALFLQYCEDVVSNGQKTFRQHAYGFALFKDGTPITPLQRTLFRTRQDLRDIVNGDPFDHPWCFSDAALGIQVIQEPAPEPDAHAVQPRLLRLYAYFLHRKPDLHGWKNHASRCETLPSYLRLVLGVAGSDESRSRPHWQGRLLMWPLWELFHALFRSTPLALLARSEDAPVPPVQIAQPAPVIARGPVSRDPIGINLVGYIAAELGIGEAARSLARACRAVSVPYSVVDVGYQSSNLQRDTEALADARFERFGIDIVYVNADQTQSTLAYMDAQGLTSAFKIGFWHWEQPVIPVAHLAAFAGLDEIWVPSAFVYNAVAAVSPVPVVIIPHALHVRATPGVQRSRFGLPEDKVIFLVMYDFHSYQYRKNPQAAITAFRQAVTGRDDAVLVVKTINGQSYPDQVAELSALLATIAETYLIDEFLTRQETWDLQSCCDVLVSLHRAEGFGLAAAEMMALGKAVVATGWSANMDFMTHDNSMPVKYRLVPLAEPVGAYPAGPLWAEADVDHAANCITQLLDQPALRRRLGDQAASDIWEHLRPEAVGHLIDDRLRAIVKWHPHLQNTFVATTNA